ncbi:MAG: hypothetical protein K0S45_4040 [Nitrospira sp.]|nr:hypothetical protein [Nitrospira sp.]MCE3224776.1 hypothetical protein [Nitrospira sp.]
MHDNASGLREVMFNSEAGEAVQIGLEAIKALSSPLFQGPLADSVRERPMMGRPLSSGDLKQEGTLLSWLGASRVEEQQAYNFAR